MGLFKRINMAQYKNWLIFLVIGLSSSSVFSQETYIFQHSHAAEEAPETSNELDADVFVGCIDYTITYLAVPTDNIEQREKAEFAIAELLKSNGAHRTDCFNANGDWLHIYKNGEQVDRIWYFSDTNEEYTFFKNGVLKFFVTDTAEPEGFSELGIEQTVKTKQKRSILGYDTVKYTATKESGTVENYWVSKDLVRNPASYKKNKFAYTDQLHDVLKGVPLYHEKTVANFVTTTREAKAIREGEPGVELFRLPAVDVYQW
ncbi:hypothetical protein J6I92_02600 [Pseudidiomarina sp. 1APR75-15]|uniref:GLPGLI family protein n=1 Tax=Pseudidiomarina terrestris TaxID=2820060 RepID=A0ABT8MFR7_9GAMM|nr:hypothetical protein [Pseudidiomarina sp. 1APR75-15]MDN7128767.1 hypothetical protein [Pseudidiomarina sp. 1APR75-15]